VVVERTRPATIVDARSAYLRRVCNRFACDRFVGRRPAVDVTVVGYNDVPTAAMADLATVRTPIEDMGAIAVRMLINQMAGHEIRSVRLAPNLIVRASSAPPRWA